MVGLDGNDNLYGKEGNDLLFGHEDNDLIEGSDGNDRIVGGDGQDILNGGSGDDKIYQGNADPNGPPSFDYSSPDGHKDTIDCGTGQDEVWLNTSVSRLGVIDTAKLARDMDKVCNGPLSCTDAKGKDEPGGCLCTAK